jgi:chorismate mutase
MRRRLSCAMFAALACASSARIAVGQQTHVLIITGLSAEPQYKAVFLRTLATLADSARSRWKVADSSLIVLGEDPADDPTRIKGKSTKAEVASAFLRLSKRVAAGDVLLVFLNGHGAGEGPGSRVNLPGPDPTAADYATWLSGFARQTIVFVNAASGSGDFLPVLAGRGRVIVTATKTGIERNETIFATPFVRGLTGTEADADKDGRISIFEAFDFAKREVARTYAADKKLLTEHATLSDTVLARRVSFGAPVGGADPKIAALVAERQALETQVADLRARKAITDSTVYATQLEKLLLELAEKSQAIRAAGGKP